jgi:hypothetical protein
MSHFRHFGSRHFGSRHFGSRHFGSRHFGSRHFGNRHFGSRHFGSRHCNVLPPRKTIILSHFTVKTGPHSFSPVKKIPPVTVRAYVLDCSPANTTATVTAASKYKISN